MRRMITGVCFSALLAFCLTGCNSAPAQTIAPVAHARLVPLTTPNEYGVQMLELAVTWRDSFTDTTQTPMGDEDFVHRAAAIIEAAQQEYCGSLSAVPDEGGWPPVSMRQP